MDNNQLLITVGTTKFNELIKEIDNTDFYLMLDRNHYSKLIIQKGNGEYEPINYKTCKLSNLKVEVHQYMTNFESVIANSHIIIAPCGAGTILEVLKHKRIFLGTVNSNLMDNHQKEIANEMAKENYIYFSEISNITNKLKGILEDKELPLKPYPSFNYDAIPNLIYDMLDIK